MALLVALAMIAASDAPATLRTYRQLTQAAIPCRQTNDKGEITVCGRREADRYRVPLTSIPARDRVPAERARLLQPPMRDCGRVGPFLSGCGFAGVTMTSGGAGTTLTGRKLAP